MSQEGPAADTYGDAVVIDGLNVSNWDSPAVFRSLDAIDDMVERIGVDHTAIGTDYTQDQPREFFDWLFSQQGTKPRERPVAYPDPLVHPTGMETPDTLSNVAQELAGRGYASADIAKILDGNWLRLFREVWGG